MQTSQAPSNPWYREPWPWFLMAGPFLAMAGCMVTIYLAMTNFADQAITEGGTRRGLVVERASVPAQPAGGMATPATAHTTVDTAAAPSR